MNAEHRRKNNETLTRLLNCGADAAFTADRNLAAAADAQSPEQRDLYIRFADSQSALASACAQMINATMAVFGEQR